MMRAFSLAAVALLATVASAAGQEKPQPTPLVPPLEYDRPYTDGPIIYHVIADAELRKKVCPTPFHVALGCAYKLPYTKVCFIILASTKEIEATRYTLAEIKRHEIGHCNGWPAWHPAGTPKKTDNTVIELKNLSPYWPPAGSELEGLSPPKPK
jgi:hypothetical protein